MNNYDYLDKYDTVECPGCGNKFSRMSYKHQINGLNYCADCYLRERQKELKDTPINDIISLLAPAKPVMVPRFPARYEYPAHTEQDRVEDIRYPLRYDLLKQPPPVQYPPRPDIKITPVKLEPGVRPRKLNLEGDET